MKKYFYMSVPEEDPSTAAIVVGTQIDLTHNAAGDVDEEATEAFEQLMEKNKIDFDPLCENQYGVTIDEKEKVKGFLLRAGWRVGEVEPGSID